MRSPNLYQYTAIGGFTHAKAIFLPPVELGVYFHALRRQTEKSVTFGIQVSPSHRRSNRPWKPNVKRVKAMVNGTPRHVFL